MSSSRKDNFDSHRFGSPPPGVSPKKYCKFMWEFINTPPPGMSTDDAAYVGREIAGFVDLKDADSCTPGGDEDDDYELVDEVHDARLDEVGVGEASCSKHGFVPDQNQDPQPAVDKIPKELPVKRQGYRRPQASHPPVGDTIAGVVKGIVADMKRVKVGPDVPPKGGRIQRDRVERQQQEQEPNQTQDSEQKQNNDHDEKVKKTDNILDRQNKAIAHVLKHFNNMVKSATEPLPENTAIQEALTQRLVMKTETAALIREIQSLLALNREIKALWIRGPLRKPGDEAGRAADAELDRKVEQVQDLFHKTEAMLREQMIARDGAGPDPGAPLWVPPEQNLDGDDVKPKDEPK